MDVTAREITEPIEWNDQLLQMPYYDLRQGFEWGEARRSNGWVPFRFAAFVGQRCVGMLSILGRRVPLLRLSVFDASGGPLLADPGHPSALAALLAEANRRVRPMGAVLLRVSPKVGDENVGVRQALIDQGLLHLSDDWTTWNGPRIVMTMDITAPEEELSRNLRKRYREYIASAGRRGVTVRSARSVDEGWDFHATLLAVGRRKGLPVRGRAYFHRLWREYLHDGKGVLLLAEHEGQAVGGLLGARLGARAYMLYLALRSGSTSRLHQAPSLCWEFIRWAREAGCTSVDWGGVGTRFPPHEDDPGFGLYRFKQGLNASLVHLTGYYDLVYRPRAYRLFRFLERRVFDSAWSLRARLNEVLSHERLDP
jgi:lipid II:glycine glycyltransferase (peptidoglycan interpeptide bridge formation enzyme)